MGFTTFLESYKVAAVQFEPKLGKLEDNRRGIVDQAMYAAEKGAKLIVFPEMATSGYVWQDREEIAPFVETVPGETTRMLHKITSQYDCYVVVGLPEVDADTGIFYNSAVLVGPEGILGCYRKTHLFAADPRWACEGKEDIPVFETKIGRISILICMDSMYFEPSRLAALKGADIIAFPTNWVGEGNKPPSKTWCLRAKENNLYWIAANRWGLERDAKFTGGSAVIGPSGEVLDSIISGDGIVFSEIPNPANQEKKKLKKRKPRAYQNILLNPYLWQEGATRPIHVAKPFDIVCVPIEEQQSINLIRENICRRIENVNFKSFYRLIVLPKISFPDKVDSALEVYQVILKEIALEYGVYIVACLDEAKDYGFCPVSFLVGPEGIFGQYSQVHVEKVSSEDSSFLTINLPFGRVGLLTGGDAEYPESYRVLAKQGADIIVVSSSSHVSYEAWMQRIWAFENDAVLAVASPTSSGESLVFLHSIVSLVSSNETPSILFQHFLPEMIEKVKGRPFLRRLNHHLYDQIVYDQYNISNRKV